MVLCCCSLVRFVEMGLRRGVKRRQEAVPSNQLRRFASAQALPSTVASREQLPRPTLCFDGVDHPQRPSIAGRRSQPFLRRRQLVSCPFSPDPFGALTHFAQALPWSTWYLQQRQITSKKQWNCSE